MIFFFVLKYVPNAKDSQNSKEVQQEVNYKRIIFYSILSFMSVNFATFFVIKGSSLITINHYGSVRDGSTVIMLISIGSLLAGAMYGTIYNRLKDHSLIFFYIICAVSFILAGCIHNLWIVYISAFLLGYGYMAFVPFLQEKVAIYGSVGTTALLILQSLGSFITPYYGVLLNKFTSSLNSQFIITGILYIILILIFGISKRVIKKKGGVVTSK